MADDMERDDDIQDEDRKAVSYCVMPCVPATDTPYIFLTNRLLT